MTRCVRPAASISAVISASVIGSGVVVRAATVRAPVS